MGKIPTSLAGSLFLLLTFASQKSWGHRDPAFCGLTAAAMSGDKAASTQVLAHTAAQATTPEGWTFLAHQLYELKRTGFLPANWSALTMVPEETAASLQRSDGREAYEVVALLDQLETARVTDADKKPTPKAAAAQNFLLFAARQAEAESARATPGSPAQLRLFAFLKTVDAQIGKTPPDTTHILKPTPTQMTRETRAKASEEIGQKITEGKRGLDQLYAERVDGLVQDGYLEAPSADPFQHRLGRTAALLSSKESAGMEAVAVLRMIRIAANSSNASLRLYAKDWLKSVFSVALPLAKEDAVARQNGVTPRGVATLEALKGIYEDKIKY